MSQKITSPERTSRDCLLIRFSEISFKPSLDPCFWPLVIYNPVTIEKTPKVLSYFRTKVSILLYFRTEVRTEVLSYFRTSSTVLLYFRPLPDRASRSNSALLPTDRAEAPEALMIGLAARVRFVFKQFLALHVRVRV